MGRPKCVKNKKFSDITYPRKCLHCEYISNNPSMYHYHTKIHSVIPAEKMCDHGCGRPATVINTNGKYTCISNSHQCPLYIALHSERVKQHWKTLDASNRKEKTKKIFEEHVVFNEAVRKKQKQTLKEKWGNFTPEQAKDYRHYARRIRAKAQQWAKDNGYELGPQTFHVDHKLSIFDAWKAGLSEKIVNHPANLRIIPSKENSSKGAKSLITIEELYEKINYEFS